LQRHKNLNIEQIEIKWLGIQLGIRPSEALALSAVCMGANTPRMVSMLSGIPNSKVYEYLLGLWQKGYITKNNEGYYPVVRQIELLVKDGKKMVKDYLDFIDGLIAIQEIKI